MTVDLCDHMMMTMEPYCPTCDTALPEPEWSEGQKDLFNAWITPWWDDQDWHTLGILYAVIFFFGVAVGVVLL